MDGAQQPQGRETCDVWQRHFTVVLDDSLLGYIKVVSSHLSGKVLINNQYQLKEIKIKEHCIH